MFNPKVFTHRELNRIPRMYSSKHPPRNSRQNKAHTVAFTLSPYSLCFPATQDLPGAQCEGCRGQHPGDADGEEVSVTREEQHRNSPPLCSIFFVVFFLIFLLMAINYFAHNTAMSCINQTA